MLFPLTYGCKELFFFPLPTRGCNLKSSWGKVWCFLSCCFQEFVHSVMGLQWITLVSITLLNLVSLMEDVTLVSWGVSSRCPDIGRCSTGWNSAWSHWRPGSINLPPWKEQTVRFAFLTHSFVSMRIRRAWCPTVASQEGLQTQIHIFSTLEDFWRCFFCGSLICKV